MVHGSSFNTGGDAVLILAIDPGNIESAYVILGNHLEPKYFGKLKNEELLSKIKKMYFTKHADNAAIEMIASYGMAVGREVFETCVWIGKFAEAIENNGDIKVNYILRKDEKINLCGSMKAKDSNIRQALIDRFGVVGTKKQPGWFYGFKNDIWQAYAVGVTYYDLYLNKAG
jgi:hypothetical protein